VEPGSVGFALVREPFGLSHELGVARGAPELVRLELIGVRLEEMLVERLECIELSAAARARMHLHGHDAPLSDCPGHPGS
jgi:hypothetical protein